VARQPRNREFRSGDEAEERAEAHRRGGADEVKPTRRGLEIGRENRRALDAIDLRRQRMIDEFTRTNDCGNCYVSIRSYLDKSFPKLLWENVSGFLAVKQN